jgi:hypothetical protein
VCGNDVDGRVAALGRPAGVFSNCVRRE